MFQRILLPVDLSDRHDAALRVAAEQCRHSSNGEIILLHVIEQIAGLTIDEERAFYDRLEASARQHLAGLGRQLEQLGVRWKAEVRVGSRVREVARRATDDGVDLVVFTSPPPADNPLAGWGSLSFRVALLVPCPVLLVR